MNRKAGFTRLETVVVACGATMLGALILPLAVRAQDAQQQQDTLKTCQSNLKQIGLGVMQYTQDYDEKYPMATYVNGRESWRSAIFPYVKGSTIFRCPANPNGFQKTQNDNMKFSATSRELKPNAMGKIVQENDIDRNGQPITIPGVQYDDSDYIEVPQLPFMPISYAANSAIMGRGGSMDLAGVNSPSELIMIGESTRGDATMPFHRGAGDFRRGLALFAGHESDPKITAQHQREIAMQNGAMTQAETEMSDEEATAEAAPEAWTICAFADGHVKAMRPMETLGMWFNVAPNQRTANDYARRLSAAEDFFTSYLYGGDAPQNVPGDEESVEEAAPQNEK